MINFKNSDFCKLLRLCAISALQISKNHFATFDFFVKTKLVLTVWVSTSLSKFGYSPSWSIGHILEHEFFCCGRLGSQGSKEKKVDLRNSEQLFRVVFFNFLWAKQFFFSKTSALKSCIN